MQIHFQHSRRRKVWVRVEQLLSWLYEHTHVGELFEYFFFFIEPGLFLGSMVFHLYVTSEVMLTMNVPSLHLLLTAFPSDVVSSKQPFEAYKVVHFVTNNPVFWRSCRHSRAWLSWWAIHGFYVREETIKNWLCNPYRPFKVQVIVALQGYRLVWRGCSSAAKVCGALTGLKVYWLTELRVVQNFKVKWQSVLILCLFPDQFNLSIPERLHPRLNTGPCGLIETAEE